MLRDRVGMLRIAQVEHERIDQSRVTLRYLNWSRSALQSLQHDRGRSLHCAASDQGTDGYARHTSALDRAPNALDGENRSDRDIRIARRKQDDICLVQRLEHAGRRPRVGFAFEANTVDGIAVCAADEPLLEREAPVRRIEPGPQHVVGGREDRGLDADRGRESRGHARKRLTSP